MHAFDEVLSPPRWGNDAVSHRFAEFVLSGTSILRDREVFGESVGAVDSHGTGHPDQLPRFDVEDFGKLIIENVVTASHLDLLR